MTTCSVEGCDRKVLARGLCHNHYQQARKRQIRANIVHPPCAFCGSEIAQQKNKNATYCSITCKQKAIDARVAADRLKRKSSRPRFCGWCKVPLDPKMRDGARFCSAACSDNWQNNARALMMLQAKKAARRPCEVCGELVPLGRHRGSLYCTPECKMLGARSKSPAAVAAQRDANLVRLYGMTTADRDAMLAAQDGQCAICGTTEVSGKGWHVDHCHASQRVRGVLCHHCNLMLGNACDDPARLRAAATYLEAHASV